MAGLKTKAEALEELGLHASAQDEDIRAAFRQRLKQAHPDLNGGTDARLRRLILARDLLITNTKNFSQPAETVVDLNIDSALGDNICPLSITLSQALFGGSTTVAVPALEFAQAGEGLTSLIQTKILHIPLPKGLRDDSTVCLPYEGANNRLFRIRIETSDDCRIWGDDIWMKAPIENRLLQRGGPTVINTPHGPRQIRLDRHTTHGASLRLKGMGLPAYGIHPAGDLHIRVEACPDTVRPANHILNEFRQRWAS